MPRNKKYQDEEERQRKKKESQSKYFKTEKGKESQKKYRKKQQNKKKIYSAIEIFDGMSAEEILLYLNPLCEKKNISIMFAS